MKINKNFDSEKNNVLPYYGEASCCARKKKDAKPCENNAYYWVRNSMTKKLEWFCGVHSSVSNRGKLEPNPDAEKNLADMLAARELKAEEEAAKNRSEKKEGHVIVTKIVGMMSKPTHTDGYRSVFPNYKQQNTRYGFGCARLSPKSLGPVEHGMPAQILPAARSIENYHQFAKHWPFELDDHGKIKEEYMEKRREAYRSEVPERHKYKREFLKAQAQSADGNANVPAFSAFYHRETGEERRYNYIECRYFYCHWYERLADKEQDMKTLRQWIKDGYNLNIQGYDGFALEDEKYAGMTLYDHYLDGSKPFGHELVLYSMLVVKEPEDYPWNRYCREYKDKYEGFI